MTPPRFLFEKREPDKPTKTKTNQGNGPPTGFLGSTDVHPPPFYVVKRGAEAEAEEVEVKWGQYQWPELKAYR